MSRYFVDARVLSIFEGADELLALKVIARRLTGERPLVPPQRSTGVLTDALPRGEVTRAARRSSHLRVRACCAAGSSSSDRRHGTPPRARGSARSSDGHPLPRSITRSPSAVSHSVACDPRHTRNRGSAAERHDRDDAARPRWVAVCRDVAGAVVRPAPLHFVEARDRWDVPWRRSSGSRRSCDRTVGPSMPHRRRRRRISARPDEPPLPLPAAESRWAVQPRPVARRCPHPRRVRAAPILARRATLLRHSSRRPGGSFAGSGPPETLPAAWVRWGGRRGRW